MKSRTIASANYAVGTYTQNIPPGAQKKFIGLTLLLSRENWPAGVDFTLSDGTVVQNTALVVSFQRTVDDVNWLKVGSWTFPGGVVLNRDGSARLQETAQLSFTDASGQPLAENGDLRVRFQALVALRTGVTAEMREIGD